MAEAQLLVTRLVQAINRGDAHRQVAEEPWVYAFPDGTRNPGKVVPLHVEYDKLTLLNSRVVGLAPFVQQTGDKLHSAARVPFIVTLLLTFSHPSPTALDTLIRLGTWLSNVAYGELIEFSEAAPVGSFDDLLQE